MIKTILSKIINVLEIMFSIAAVILLFVGGLTFIGFVIAFFVGGSTAEAISVFIYSKVFKVLIYVASITTMTGLLTIYLKKEKFLTSSDK